MYKNDLRYIIKGTTNHLAPPKSFDPDASLETVDLNEDDSGLEKFLSEDLLDDASPLPKDDEGNLPSLNKFLNKVKSVCFKVNTKNSFFTRNELEHLGFKITRKGIMPLPDKVQAIKDIAVPTNVYKLYRSN